MCRTFPCELPYVDIPARSSIPSLDHSMLGTGFPDATHVKYNLSRPMIRSIGMGGKMCISWTRGASL